MAVSDICCGCAAWDTKTREPMRGVLGRRCPFPRLSSRVSIPKGQSLYHQGDRVAGAFSLASGMVALERVDEDGDLVILKILHAGAFFPCADVLGDGFHESSARALSDVTGCFVPVERLNIALRDDPDVGRALLKLSSAEIHENEETIFRLCSTDLPERVLAALAMLANEMGETDGDGNVTLTLPMSWRDLAAMVGTGPEVISRLLRRLADTGRLSFRGRTVTLHRTATRTGAEAYC